MIVSSNAINSIEFLSGTSMTTAIVSVPANHCHELASRRFVGVEWKFKMELTDAKRDLLTKKKTEHDLPFAIEKSDIISVVSTA